MFAAEEEAVRDGGTLLFVPREAIEVELAVGPILGAIEAFKEAAIKNGTSAKCSSMVAGSQKCSS